MASNGKFVAYYRVSTERQGRSGLGLEAQQAAVATYLNGGDWRIVAEFTEFESGRRSDRPELDKALGAARLHRCPLVVSKVDRLTRSVAFLSRLLEAGVDVRFADLPQIEGATGRFLLQQMVAVAELEAGMISTRTKAALAAAKARGRTLGGPRVRKSDGRSVVIDRKAQKSGAAANRKRAVDRAADLALKIVDAAAFYRYRRENPEFERFVAAAIVNNTSRGQQIRYARERTRVRSAARREEANDYQKILAMFPVNFPGRNDAAQDVFVALCDGSLKRVEVRLRVKQFMADYDRMFPTNFAKFGNAKLVSLDEVLFDDGTMTRGDTITRGFWD
jgi:DNA invertase Pin-like site-specific DNA recombinase